MHALPPARARLMESSSSQPWLPHGARRSGAHRRSVRGWRPARRRSTGTSLPRRRRDRGPARSPAAVHAGPRAAGAALRWTGAPGQHEGPRPATLGKKVPFMSPGIHTAAHPPPLSPRLCPPGSARRALWLNAEGKHPGVADTP